MAIVDTALGVCHRTETLQLLLPVPPWKGIVEHSRYRCFYPESMSPNAGITIDMALICVVRHRWDRRVFHWEELVNIVVTAVIALASSLSGTVAIVIVVGKVQHRYCHHCQVPSGKAHFHYRYHCRYHQNCCYCPERFAVVSVIIVGNRHSRHHCR